MRGGLLRRCKGKRAFFGGAGKQNPDGVGDRDADVFEHSGSAAFYDGIDAGLDERVRGHSLLYFN